MMEERTGLCAGSSMINDSSLSLSPPCTDRVELSETHSVHSSGFSLLYLCWSLYPVSNRLVPLVRPASCCPRRAALCLSVRPSRKFRVTIVSNNSECKVQ